MASKCERKSKGKDIVLKDTPKLKAQHSLVIAPRLPRRATYKKGASC